MILQETAYWCLATEIYPDIASNRLIPSVSDFSAIHKRKRKEMRGLLRHINMTTYCVADLDTVVDAWVQWMDFRVVESGEVTADLCAVWDTPAMQGMRYAILQPASGTEVYLRYIETGENLPFGAPMYCGWTANEFLAEDVDELARKLEGSPFKLIGGPNDLFPRAKAPRAIQAIGPSGELVYFTRMLPGGTVNALKGAKSFVDRTFNVISAGHNIEAMRHFYHDLLHQKMNAPISMYIPYLAEACGVPGDTIFHIQVAKIRVRRSIVELDQFPASVAARPRTAGQLPPGFSMVSFYVDNLDNLPVELRAAPKAIESKVYGGCRSAVAIGAAGEWLELIERKIDRSRD